MAIVQFSLTKKTMLHYYNIVSGQKLFAAPKLGFYLTFLYILFVQVIKEYYRLTNNTRILDSRQVSFRD